MIGWAPRGEGQVTPPRLREKEVVWDCRLGKEAAESKGRETRGRQRKVEAKTEKQGGGKAERMRCYSSEGMGN